MNYIAYFKSLSGQLYRVRIITDSQLQTWKEYKLSGERPVVVTYTTSERLFDPVRTSTCTVSLLAEDYPLNIYSGKADGTEVILDRLRNGTEDIYDIEWEGYVQPNLYSQGYSEPIEVLEVECSDYLSALQYFDYETVGPKKGIVSFLDILKKMFSHFLGLKGFYYSLSASYDDKQSPEAALTLDKMYISEENFFSKEGEPWKLSEVLEEMMKFLGLTIYQDKDSFIMADYSCRKSGQETCTFYDKSDNWSSVITSNGHTRSINAGDYMLTGADMSLDDVFNKVTVKDSFYNVNNLLPDLFNKDRLRNLNGEFDTIFQRKAFLVPGQYGPNDGNQGDCYYKFYDHKDWKQHCYTLEHLEGRPNEVVLPDNVRGDTTSMRKYISPALINFGFRLWYENDKPVDFKNYLVLCQQLMPIHYPTIHGMEILESGYVPLIDTEAIAPMIYGNDSWLILSCNSSKTFYVDKPWLNTDSKTMHKKIDLPPSWLPNPGYVGKYYDYKITSLNLQPEMVFKLRINGKWWNGSGWQAQECNFKVATGKLSSDSFFQTDVGIKNNVTADTFVGEVGYRIKLPEIENIATNIYFAICPPKPLVISDASGQSEGPGGDAETWISNISFKIVKQGQQIWRDDDVIYSNVIDGDNVQDGPQITCRFTSEGGKSFSYSNVGVKMWDGKIVPMTVARKKGFENSQRPEENIVESYVRQYSTPSIRENVTLTLNYGMNDIITDNYWHKNFLCLGTEKDYAYDRQTLNLIENK